MAKPPLTRLQVKLPGRVSVTIEAPEGTTVADALAAAANSIGVGFDITQVTVLLDGVPVTIDDLVSGAKPDSLLSTAVNLQLG